MTTVDGRVTRGTRNRQAIIDALLGCYEAGILRPSISRIAERAGVSVRSVHNHFDDVEAIRAEVAERQWERFASLIGPGRTVEELFDQQVAFYEAVTPVRRAALLSAHDSPSITKNLVRLDRILRGRFEVAFPTLTPDAFEAIAMVSSWDAWNRLRSAQGCTVARARAIVVNLLHGIVDGAD